MSRYISKPQEIEAVRWRGHSDSYEELLDARMPVRINPETAGVELAAGKHSVQGWVPVPVGHWVVRQPDDLTDHWPVDPDYFASKYTPKEQA